MWPAHRPKSSCSLLHFHQTNLNFLHFHYLNCCHLHYHDLNLHNLLEFTTLPHLLFHYWISLLILAWFLQYYASELTNIHLQVVSTCDQLCSRINRWRNYYLHSMSFLVQAVGLYLLLMLKLFVMFWVSYHYWVAVIVGVFALPSVTYILILIYISLGINIKFMNSQ